MEKITMKIFKIVLFVLLAGMCNVTFSQQVPVTNDYSDVIEKLQIITDRSTYIVGEELSFLIHLSLDGTSQLNEWSKVAYLELISFDGIASVKVKLPVQNQKAFGEIKIPEDLPSGNYYLKAYTRWLRNFNPGLYAYTPITIINFNSDQMVASPVFYTPDFYVDTVSLKINPLENFTLGNTETSKRKVQKVLFWSDNKVKPVHLIVNVTRDPLFEANTIAVIPNQSDSGFDLLFSPETRGVSISGTLVNIKTKEPMPNQMVSVSLIANRSQNLSVVSNENGKFNVNLGNQIGSKEILITSNNTLAEIKVDNDFCNKVVKLPFLPLNLDALNKMELFRSIKIGVIEKQFEENKHLETLPQDKTTEQYYAEPTMNIVLSEYIPLPTLKDYFYELIPQASIRTENGKSSIQILGAAADLLVYPPLVLIDNIIVTEIDKLLEVSPKRIERIEILNKPYIKGDLTYGGIVNIFSKEGDLAGMELPKSGLFFNYQLFSEQQTFNYDQPVPENEPIMRNTLYWKVLGSDTENLSELTFNVGDLPGKYMVQLYSITLDGTVVSDTASFTVQ
jgi:hypothetical protein